MIHPVHAHQQWPFVHALRLSVFAGWALFSFLFSVPCHAAAPVDDVTDYAKACYARLKIQEKDFAGPFKCKEGVQLVVKKDGKTLDIAVKDVPNPDNAKGFPADCDFPAWLPNFNAAIPAERPPSFGVF